jgi:predicted CoA-binding protein
MLVSLPEIAAILEQYRRIAIVGLSPKKNRPSHQVARYLLSAGYSVIPVNPGHDHLLGLPCYPHLAAIPTPIDIVNIFRRAAEVPAIVNAAIAIGARVVWMQEGIVHEEAALMARQAGLTVIMDRCLKMDHISLLGSCH